METLSSRALPARAVRFSFTGYFYADRACEGLLFWCSPGLMSCAQSSNSRENTGTAHPDHGDGTDLVFADLPVDKHVYVRVSPLQDLDAICERFRSTSIEEAENVNRLFRLALQNFSEVMAHD